MEKEARSLTLGPIKEWSILGRFSWEPNLEQENQVRARVGGSGAHLTLGIVFPRDDSGIHHNPRDSC